MKRFNISSILAMVVTLSGIAASPLIGGLVGAKIAAGLIAAGSVAQAITRAIHDVQEAGK